MTERFSTEPKLPPQQIAGAIAYGKLGEFPRRHPAGLAGIVSRPDPSALVLGTQIDDDIVKPYPPGFVPLEMIKSVHRLQGPDGHSGLFPYLPFGGCLQRLAQTYLTPRYGPEILGRRLTTTDEQHPVIAEHDRTDRYHGSLGEDSLRFDFGEIIGCHGD